MSPGILRMGMVSRMHGGTAPFSPSDIAGQLLWLDANAITGLNDSDPVGAWEDSSTSNNDATQGTAGKKPLYKTNIANGKPGLLFDGTDDQLVLTGFPTIGGATFPDMAYFFVAQPLTGTDTYSTWLSAGASNGFWFKGDTKKLSFYTASDHLNSTAINFSETHLWSLEQVGGSSGDSQFYLDGTADGTHTGVGLQWAPNSIGDDSGSETFKGYLFEMLVYTTALSAQNRSDLTAYLKTKYGIA